MCYLLLAINQSSQFPFILAANRDEYYLRKSAQLHFWQDKPHIAGGRDLEQGGTWMAVNRSGKFAAITNYRENKNKVDAYRSRGLLITDYLEGDISDEAFSIHLTQQKHQYDGFNLIYGQLPDKLFYFSNRSADGPTRLASGYYALSNHLLDTPWPKIVHGKQTFEKIIHQDDLTIKSALFELLGNEDKADIADLPATGVREDFEHLLSSIYIESKNYGTRCSSVLMADKFNTLNLTELTHHSEVALKENPIQLSLQM